MSSSYSNNNVILDALPYVDVVHEDYEAYALALVQEEMAKTSAPPVKKVASLESSSQLLQEEYKTIASGNERPPLKLDSDITVSSSKSEEEWKECIKQARIAYEKERLRSQVLELEQAHAPNQWKHYTSQLLEPLQQYETQQHAQLQSQLEEIHAQRQGEQVEASKTLTLLDEKYRGLIQKRHYLQMATLELEREIKRIKASVDSSESQE